jgi:hypothetical protein
MFTFLKHLPQKHDKNKKNGNLKNSSQRWILFSQLLIPVKHLREVIVLPLVSEKNLSRVFKIPFGFPKNALGK